MKNWFVFFGMYLVLNSFSVNAQIPNPSFENWDAIGNPVDWQATNAPPVYITITKSSDAHSGSWAVQGDVAQVSFLTVGPSIYSGTDAVGFPVNFRPGALKGYYKFTSIQDDYMQVQVNFRKNGVYIGGGANNLSPTGTYTQFNIDIGFISPDVPDTALIAVFVTHAAGFPHLGSKMLIDDLAWGGATDVSDMNISNPTHFNLEQNFPNPFNPSTKISWQSPVSSHQTLKVYDALGNEVATLVDEYREAGKYEVDFNGKYLASGIYLYRLYTGNYSETQKMVIAK